MSRLVLPLRRRKRVGVYHLFSRVPHLSEARVGFSQTRNPNHTAAKNLPNHPTQFATIEIEQTNQNATKPVAFSFV
jgi:hypothetical protein